MAPTAWICSQCKGLIDNQLTLCSLCGASRSPMALAEVARDRTGDPDDRDLAMEGHLRAIALWYRLYGILGFFSALWLLFFGVDVISSAGGFGRFLGEIAVVLGIVFVLSSAGCFAAGLFLDRFANGGRIAVAIFAAFTMASQLLRTCVGPLFSGQGPSVAALESGVITLVWSGAVMWALFHRRSSQICTPRYREGMARTADTKSRMSRSPFFWAPFVFIGYIIARIAVAVAMHGG